MSDAKQADQHELRNGLLCDDCGEAFSDFLQEMADKNAKVATCPKCGKIHQFDPENAASAASSAKKII